MIGLVSLVLLVACCTSESISYPCVGSQPPAFCNDEHVSLLSPEDVDQRRAQLLEWLWGAGGLPTSEMPTSIEKNVSSPVAGLEGLVARVDVLLLQQSEALTTESLHFAPAQRPNGQAVLLHHGHACTFDDYAGPLEQGYGMQRTIRALLGAGFGVLAVYMPHMRPGDCGVPSHGDMFRNGTGDAAVMAQFLAQALVSVNALQGQYRQFHMIGLSGGGWSTTLYPTLDTRIGLSFPVAGSIPLYLRSGGSEGDMEQYDGALYSQVRYLDLYVMTASGGRSVVQVLNQHDDCCFGERQHNATAWGPWAPAMRAYAGRAAQAVAALELGGSFTLVLDSHSTAHMISHWAIDTVIMPRLAATIN